MEKELSFSARSDLNATSILASLRRTSLNSVELALDREMYSTTWSWQSVSAHETCCGAHGGTSFLGSPYDIRTLLEVLEVDTHFHFRLVCGKGEMEALIRHGGIKSTVFRNNTQVAVSDASKSSSNSESIYSAPRSPVKYAADFMADSKHVGQYSRASSLAQCILTFLYSASSPIQRSPAHVNCIEACCSIVPPTPPFCGVYLTKYPPGGL